MPLFSGRRRPHLAPALDDDGLGRIVNSLQEVPRSGLIGMRDLHMARISDLLRQGDTDWDRRAHRLAVLAEATADSDLPDTWCAREPRSVDALLLRAWVQWVRARRSGDLTGAEAIVRDCYQASERRPNDPTPWVIVLGVQRLQRRSRPAVMAAWRQVSARDRVHREAHLQMLGHLSPGEGGSRIQVLEFVDHVRSVTPPNAPTAALDLTAAVQHYHSVLRKGGVETLLASNVWRQLPAVDALDRAAAHWLKPGFLSHAAALADLNLLAYALVVAGRRGDAAEVFPELRGRVTSWPWENSGAPVDVFSHEMSRSAR
ncbi:hypothetical protein [Streptomyces scopuliridis]|uniref:hypothetical protein n=1 Tax=Streptomyces scopuliridis TaxID=452529 RepID=UPI00341E6C00